MRPKAATRFLTGPASPGPLVVRALGDDFFHCSRKGRTVAEAVVGKLAEQASEPLDRKTPPAYPQIHGQRTNDKSIRDVYR